MLQLTQSPFLQALGYTIINSLWQFALLWLIYVSIHTFLKLSSHQKYVTGVLMQAAGFASFAATFVYYLNRFSRLQEMNFYEKNSYFAFADNNATTIREKIFAGLVQAEIVLPYLSVAYLLVLFFLAFKWIRAYKHTKAIKTSGLQKIEIKWRLFVKQLSTQLAIKREVRIFISEKVTTPLTIGFLKPLILIPVASLNLLSPEQMEAVILHELAHIKRSDYLINLFLAIIEISLFFNPFMHLISGHVKRERENCCDDWVLQYEYNAASYANALLQIANRESSFLLTLQAADNKKILLYRIIRMIEKKEKSFFNYRYQLVALVVMLTVLSSLALLSSSHSRNKSISSRSSKQVIVEPMAEIVNNPLLNPDFFIAADEERLTKPNNFLSKKARISIVDRNVVDEPRFKENKIQTATKKPVSKTHALPAPPIPAIPGNAPAPAPAAEENLAENVDTYETVFQPDTDALEQQNLEIEAYLKTVIVRFLEKNKSATDQKKVLSQIETAMNHLKKIKFQKRIPVSQINIERAFRNYASPNQLAAVSCFSNRELSKLTEELHLKTEQFRKQTEKTNERVLRGDNFKMPNTTFRIPFVENPHSFSFEISTAPLAEPGFFEKEQNPKKVTKKLKPGNNRNINLQSASPFTFDSAVPEFRKETRNVVVIRI